jgi:DNA-binding helix-turn-helix protein
LDAGNLSRIENGLIDPKLSMLWRLSEAIDMPLSEIFKILEDNLGKDFYVIDK